MGLGIGGHTKPIKGETVVWLTPPEIIGALGIFDLDPCSAPSPRPWDTALAYYELPQDGLQLPWYGRVWMNPPYDQSLGKWMKQMRDHRSGIALVFARVETEIWQDLIWPVADAILFPRGRPTFYRADGTRGSSNSGGPIALISYSPFDTAILQVSGIKGSLQQAWGKKP